MSLPAFFRGARPNPQDLWTLWHRHAEGGPWTPVVEVESGEGLAEEVAAGTRGWPLVASAGDVAWVTRGGETATLFGVDEGGALVRLPTPQFSESPRTSTWPRDTWVSFWDGCTDLVWMLDAAAAARLDRTLLLDAVTAVALVSMAELDVDTARSIARAYEERLGAALDSGRPARVHGIATGLANDMGIAMGAVPGASSLPYRARLADALRVALPLRTVVCELVRLAREVP